MAQKKHPLTSTGRLSADHGRTTDPGELEELTKLVLGSRPDKLGVKDFR